ncbi:MAG: transposase [Dehalobacterium sp.]
MGKLDSPITTIIGIGNVTVATIISGIEDMSNKFDNPRKLCSIIYAVLKNNQPYVPKV